MHLAIFEGRPEGLASEWGLLSLQSVLYHTSLEQCWQESNCPLLKLELALEVKVGLLLNR